LLVRLVDEYRRGADVLRPGVLLDVDVSEAASLIVGGRAVPVVVDRRAVETRAG
jgi:hypothetical protein